MRGDSREVASGGGRLVEVRSAGGGGGGVGSGWRPGPGTLVYLGLLRERGALGPALGVWSGRHLGLPSLFPSLFGSWRLREFQWLPFRISPLPLLEGARPGPLSLPALLVPVCTCGPAQRSGGERSHVRRVDRAGPSSVSLSGCLFLHPALDPHPLSLGRVGEQLPLGQLLHSQKPINIY